MAKPFFYSKKSFFLIDDYTLNGYKDAPVQSGWDIDTRENARHADETDTSLVLSTDAHSKYDVFIQRNIQKQSSGKVSFTFMFSLVSPNGFYITFSDKDKKSNVLEISVSSGRFCVNGKQTDIKAQNKSYRLDGTFDLDKKECHLCFDGIFCDVIKLNNSTIELVKTGAKAFTETSFIPCSLRMWKNYLICDKYAPYFSSLWNFEGTEGSGFISDDFHRIVCEKESKGTVYKSFDEKCKTLEFEAKYFLSGSDGCCKISLTQDKEEVITLTDNSSQLSFNNKLIKTHLKNVWQTIRVIADFEYKELYIYLNGKYCSCHPIENGAEYADGLKFEFTSKSYGEMRFCDICAFATKREEDDYVPTPILPNKKGYVVGINTCSLWRNGLHRGWDVITPFEENKTYLGYYDEGTPAVSDWEIKWMLESGIDFQFFCWFNSRTKQPIIKTAHSVAIHDGYFKAKYSDFLKFGIIWEASGGCATSREDFRNNIVPYWLEYFLCDDRYIKLNNKVLIGVYGVSALIRDFGSAEKVKEEIDYLNEKVKETGLDGVIFICCGKPSEEAKKCGFEGVFAYNWTENGFSGDFTKRMITRQRNNNCNLNIIPTISTGFNCVAWHGKRYPQMNCDDMGELLQWFTDELVKPTVECHNVLEKLIMLSTWNEYGEGTFMCPSELCGFGYLDEVKKAFTFEKGPSSHIKPTEKQISEMCRIYPESRGILKPLRKAERIFLGKVCGNLDDMKQDWICENGLCITEKDNAIYGTSDDFDPHMILTNLNIDASKIKCIRIKIRACSPSGSDDFSVLYFKTLSSPSWSESKSIKLHVSGKEIRQYCFDFSDVPTWLGTITELRFDPTSAEGSFEIHSIELMENTKTPTIEFDGAIYKPSVPVLINETGIYIPFESYKDFGNLKVYSSWNRTSKQLELVYEDITCRFTVGERNATVNGKEMQLSEPLTLYDGLPMLNLDFLCKVWDLSLSFDKDSLKFTIQSNVGRVSL